MTTFTLSKNSILRCCNSCLIVVLIELILIFFLLSFRCKIIPENMMVAVPIFVELIILNVLDYL